MALTLLNAVNAVAKRARLLHGDADEFTSLVSGNYQPDVDTIVQVINETICFMYDESGLLPESKAEGTIVLALADRSYAVPDDWESMVSETLIDRTNGYQIFRFEAGYVALVEQQLQPDSYEGRPYFWVMNPVNREIYLDSIPTAEDVGLTYTFVYNKTLHMSLAADTFPFSDECVRDLVPAFTEYWSKRAKETFDEAVFSVSVARVVVKLHGHPVKTRR